MFCKNCGTQLETGISFCPNCGTAVEAPKQPEQQQYQQPQNNYQQPQYQQAPYQNQGNYQQNPYAQNPYQQPIAPATPMKWFKFLIYFALWAGAVLNILSGISLLTGAQYDGAASLVYAIYKDLKTIDMLSGLLCIAIGVLGIVTRFSLAGFKKNGPKLVLALYGAGVVVNIFYMIGVSSVLPELLVKELDFTSFISGTVTSVIMIVANYVYFNKRKNLFNR